MTDFTHVLRPWYNQSKFGMFDEWAKVDALLLLELEAFLLIFQLDSMLLLEEILIFGWSNIDVSVFLFIFISMTSKSRHFLLIIRSFHSDNVRHLKCTHKKYRRRIGWSVVYLFIRSRSNFSFLKHRKISDEKSWFTNLLE